MCRPGLGRCRRSSRAPPPIDLWPPVGAQHAAPVLGNQHRCGLSFSFSTPSPNSLCAFSQSLYFPLLESVPYLSAKRVFRRSAASPPLSSESVAARAWAFWYVRQPPQTSHTPSSYACALRSSHSPNKPPPPPPSKYEKRG